MRGRKARNKVCELAWPTKPGTRQLLWLYNTGIIFHGVQRSVCAARVNTTFPVPRNVNLPTCIFCFGSGIVPSMYAGGRLLSSYDTNRYCTKRHSSPTTLHQHGAYKNVQQKRRVAKRQRDCLHKANLLTHLFIFLLNLLCMRSPRRRKLMRAEEQKQECKLEWPYCEEGGRTEASTIQQKQIQYSHALIRMRVRVLINMHGILYMYSSIHVKYMY